MHKKKGMNLTSQVHADNYTAINNITWYSLLPAPQYKHMMPATVITGSISAQNESLFTHQSKLHQLIQHLTPLQPVTSPFPTLP